MNPLTDLIFSLTWIVLFAFAIRSIIKGWSISKDIPMQGYSVEKKMVTKMPHPEMAEVKNGDELLVVKFDEPDQIDRSRFKLDSPEIHNLGDPLHKSLQDRIEELNDPWEDDDDDDGDVVVRR